MGKPRETNKTSTHYLSSILIGIDENTFNKSQLTKSFRLLSWLRMPRICMRIESASLTYSVCASYSSSECENPNVHRTVFAFLIVICHSF